MLAYGRSDRIAPEFRFSALELVYDSQTTDRQLKEGINAYDAKDGDLTGRIVVEKVVLNRDAGTAVVYYAVSDLSGNVTKESRVFSR
ncbi:immunoglobulin-like domain-containing protein [Butyrivibrio sp. FCS014]|uniref:immunoglobulin-like domain-containing protein n=1 Tax=Butyrivibrio sp. FCS014 TaxID=1408304 RepID=UPI0004639436|nr:immunoglobulin-like domain-containing protein [Butyrivibrio sp. FCS014]